MTTETSLAGQFQRDGFAGAGRVLGPGDVARARAASDQVCAEHGGRSEYGVIALQAFRHHPVFMELLAPVARVACDLLGTDRVVAFQDLIIDKLPGAPSMVPWHQDGIYLPLDREDGAIGWIALDDADERRGCLKYVAGSHLLGPRAPARFGGEPPREDETRPPIDPEGREVVVAESEAGDAWFHWPMTWHASPPNTTTEPRRAWSVWFVREEVRWDVHRANHPYLLEFSPHHGDPLDEARFPRFAAAA